MYWIETTGSFVLVHKVKSADMNASSQIDLPCDSTRPSGLATFDKDTTETIYWVDGSEGKV